MKCKYCGQENEENAKYCQSCGRPFIEENYGDWDINENKEQEPAPSNKDWGPNDYEIITPEKSNVVYCPKCGSSNIHFVTKEEGSNFDAMNGCCGFILFGPLGILCGLFSNKSTKTIRKCMKCGQEF